MIIVLRLVVCIIKGSDMNVNKPIEWATIKATLHTNLVKTMMEFTPDKLSDVKKARLKEYIVIHDLDRPDMRENIKKCSIACSAFLEWALAILS